jgi:hypothetical protein
VEDFSLEWWCLVAASPAFRGCWLDDYGALGLLDAGDCLDDDAGVDSFLPDDLIVSPLPPLMRQGTCASFVFPLFWSRGTDSRGLVIAHGVEIGWDKAAVGSSLGVPPQ